MSPVEWWYEVATTIYMLWGFTWGWIVRSAFVCIDADIQKRRCSPDHIAIPLVRRKRLALRRISEPKD